MTDGVPQARLARIGDVTELVRLRGVMYDVTEDENELNAPWREACAKTLNAHLGDPDTDWVAYVVDRPDEPEKLACCALGVIERRLPSPSSVTGMRGHVFNVATDVAYRRRGYARAAMEGLLLWYFAHGVNYVTLGASSDGEPLYTQMGFIRGSDPTMWLRIDPSD